MSDKFTPVLGALGTALYVYLGLSSTVTAWPDSLMLFGSRNAFFVTAAILALGGAFVVGGVSLRFSRRLNRAWIWLLLINALVLGAVMWGDPPSESNPLPEHDHAEAGL
ncbi:hypothetical protein COW36_01555 [bacterium (Candidatus Blackallbacteria) CG17_big_fil_post_rev_8_21_14_2_50_48_46]|uniref:Uncharacterized protein n=1 Tax=bacterium (Candidatus Blackallbacteria) CG17_big_fil_post_rev_8_21_14_2_50_48_46 TaxID=2014261 RepID=A0A2M7GBI9_9BACT|nr:MAG: hypothetical protein COW64_09620 [bacterium (Candidatus Blackallbacteria) CG18_big_fil_WC_8_21_14_2_50_49_26]PIW19551.1 MAG: hypothetical protein COW36_01555 [bacterium (Candidatus Blackallbacteria) CG17_big_fil_post_rev_8_21_14_2_50_48_46]PIW48846.1 MAG: hypothetical protein COW20_06900 [bacterium (Candidatus Blackallbacteria) CG13_big_fil_rev_8_21_14_2_50_49_14]